MGDERLEVGKEIDANSFPLLFSVTPPYLVPKSGIKLKILALTLADPLNTKAGLVKVKDEGIPSLFQLGR